MDETYIKVGGKDRFLYRAVDKQGNTVDFLLKKEDRKCLLKSSSIKR
ncbi:MAG: DDE-type integrase/transposase/recombinase [Flavobacteriales bacterium]|nr:DDE-type integrase/transposase/recombinase [Flavobacteriales bacterium]